MKVNLKGPLSTGLLFAALAFLVCRLFIGFAPSVILGIAVGCVFTAVTAWLLSRTLKSYRDIDSIIGQPYLMKDMAIIFQADKAVNGVLCLTGQKLIFISRVKNRNMRLEFNVGDIKCVEYNKSGFSKNGIIVTMKNSSVSRFSLQDYRKFYNKLSSLIKT